MSERSGSVRNAFALRLSVPATGELRGIAPELAARIAEHFGVRAEGTPSMTSMLEELAASVDPGGQGAEIEFDFRHSGRELVIAARSGTQTSEARYPLPA